MLGWADSEQDGGMTENHKVNFEYSVDEAVAFQIEFLRTTKEGSSWRNRERWTFAIAYVFIVGCWFVFGLSDRSPASVLGSVVIAIVVGTIATILFGHYYDHLVRTRLRRLIVEQVGPGPYTSAIEIRSEGLWVTQPGVELTFPWRDARTIQDTSEGIIVMFAGGRVIAHARGFGSQAHHDSFLASLRQQASAAET
jgi:hypothetical protein